jgi:hypothetical protein
MSIGISFEHELAQNARPPDFPPNFQDGPDLWLKLVFDVSQLSSTWCRLAEAMRPL